ncbi:uncharacterized protein LOC134777263 [Penaeus indicus]|uniref:uncharacterized protein LOC134777263 n=1 Tax=Penaeus indicus TaxID=29960 RepID=UPI00300C2ACD
MKVFILLGMVTFAASGSFESYEYRPPRRSSEESYESGEAKYNFNWAVSDDSSSNEFGHQEARDGDDTQGSYYVQLPDGRLQTVKQCNGANSYKTLTIFRRVKMFPHAIYRRAHVGKEAHYIMSAAV